MHMNVYVDTQISGQLQQKIRTVEAKYAIKRSIGMHKHTTAD